MADSSPFRYHDPAFDRYHDRSIAALLPLEAPGRRRIHQSIGSCYDPVLGRPPEVSGLEQTWSVTTRKSAVEYNNEVYDEYHEQD